LGYYAYWSTGNYHFQGKGIGCAATGTKGSDFPKTLIEWNVRPGSAIDVGIMLKLGENPYYPYSYPNQPHYSGFFIKNAGAYPEAEVPEDAFGLSGMGLSGNLTFARWDVRVWPNDSISLLGGWPPSLVRSTAPFAVLPGHWYSLRILIEGDRHTFYVDGQEIATITAHSEYSKRTAFGVMLADLSYACFGDYYVKSFPASILSTTPASAVVLHARVARSPPMRSHSETAELYVWTVERTFEITNYAVGFTSCLKPAP
jgi:hypothetical protein